MLESKYRSEVDNLERWPFSILMFSRVVKTTLDAISSVKFDEDEADKIV